MDHWQPLQTLHTRTLRDNVVSLLREAIVKGTLPAGIELNQAHVAERLGISRGPLREALGQLEQENLIRTVPYKGSVVTSLTPTYLSELYSLRKALEQFAVEQLLEPSSIDVSDDAPNIDAILITTTQKLRSVVDDMHDAALAQDNDGLVELDLSFHRIIIEAPGHSLLKHTWSPLEMGVKRCLYTRHKIYRSLDQVIGNHPDIIEAIEAKNINAAKALLHDHIMEAGKMMQQYWEEAPETEPVSSEVVLDSLQAHLSERLDAPSVVTKVGSNKAVKVKR
ncbi:MAG: GntR family transcriptional regulator [Deinococcota bacterium]